MSDAVFRVTEEYEGARFAAIQAALDSAQQRSLFGTEPRPAKEAVNADIVSGLIPDILAVPSMQRRFTLAELEEFLLTAWFGRAIDKHFRRACTQLVKEKKARIVAPKPVTTFRKNARIVIGVDTVIELL